MKKRILALWLALALLLGSGAGTTVFAAEGGSTPNDEGCTHTHNQVNSGEACGYLEGAPCSHVCEADCAGGCTHTGHDGSCGHIAAAPCTHEHDGGCGALPAGQTDDPPAPADDPATPADVPTPAVTPQAADDVVDIGGMANVAGVRSAIQAAIDVTAPGEVVTVTNTGAAFNAGTAALTLDIPQGIAVEWNADYYGSVEYSLSDPYKSLINITGGGTFEVTGGEIENIENVLNSQGNITVSGGGIIAQGGEVGRGIIATGSHPIVRVTGGSVSCPMPGYAIYSECSGVQVHVSGGTVSANSSAAIMLDGENAVLTLSGKAAVSSGGLYSYGVEAGGSHSSVSVSGNATITEGIRVGGSIRVSGGTVSKSNGGGAVYAISGASVSVSGGRLESTAFVATAITGAPDEVNISGGTLTASGSIHSSVILLDESSTRVSITGGLIETGEGATRGILAGGDAVITVTGGMVRIGENPGTDPSAITALSENALVFVRNSCVEGSVYASNSTKVIWDDSGEIWGYAPGSTGDLTIGPVGSAVWARLSEESGVSCTLQNGAIVFVPIPFVYVGAENPGANGVAAQITAWSAAHAGSNIMAWVTDASTVTVTGTAVDIAETLVVNIPQGVGVLWQASITAAAGFDGTMVRLPRGGAFTMAAGLIRSNSVAINGMTPDDSIYPLVCKLSGGAVFGKMSNSFDLYQFGTYYSATGKYECRTAPIQATRSGAIDVTGCVLMAVNTTVTGGTPTMYVFPTLDGGIIKHTNAATVVWGQKQIDGIWHNGINYEWGNNSGFIPFTIRYYTGRNSKDYFTYTLPAGLVADGSQHGIGTVTPLWGGLAPFTVYYQGTSGTTYEKSTTPPSTAGTYQVTVTTEGELFSTMEGKSLGSYTINPVTIEITTQPSDATVLEGTGAVLTTAATINNGDTPDYTWFYCNSSGVASGAALGTGASYSTGSSLALGEHYFICRVSADNAASVYTNVAKVTVAAVTAPGTPTDLAATPGDGQVTLSWTTPGNGNSAITAYQYSASAGEDDWQDIPESGPSTTSYTVAGLTNGTQYTFKIRAVNAIGAGAAASAEATPQAAAPGGSIKLDKARIQLWNNDTPSDNTTIRVTPSIAMPLYVEFYDITGTRRIASTTDLPFDVDTLALADDENDQTLTVTAKPGKVGSALVRVVRTDDHGVMAQCRIDVSAKTVYADIEKDGDLAGYTLDPAATTLYSRGTAAATISLWPRRASGKTAVRLNDKASVSIRPVESKTKTANPLSIFTFTAVDECTVEVAPEEDFLTNSTAALKSSYKGKIEIVVKNGSGELVIPITQPLTVKVNNKKPALKATAISANAFYEKNRTHGIEITGADAADITALQTVKLEAGKSTGTKSQVNANAALAKKGITFENGQIKFTPNAKGGGTLYLEALVQDWTQDKNGRDTAIESEKWVPVAVKVTATNTQPAVKLQNTSFKVYDSPSSTGNVLRIVPKNNKNSLAQYDIANVTIDETLGAGANYTSSYSAGSITVRSKYLAGETAEENAKPAPKDTLTFIVTTGTGETFPLTARVSAVVADTAKPTLKASKTSVTLNPNINESYDIALSASIEGYSLAGRFVGKEADADYLVWTSRPKGTGVIDPGVAFTNGNTLRITSAGATPGTYKLKLNLPDAYVNGRNVSSPAGAVSITVKVSAHSTGAGPSDKGFAGPKVSLAAKGKMDLSRPAAAVTVTARLANYNGGFGGEPNFYFYTVTGSGASRKETPVDAGQFLIEPGAAANTWLITPGVPMTTGTYYVAMNESTLDDAAGSTVETAVSRKTYPGIAEPVKTTAGARFMVAASKPKVTAGPAAVTLYQGDEESVALFRLSVPGGTAAIDHTLTAMKEDTASKRLTLHCLGGGWYVIGFDTAATEVVKKGQAPVPSWQQAKTTTITLNIYLEGNETKKNGALIPPTTTKIKVNVKK